jgi:tetratricopeptide (TPR) repeat protein
VCSINICLATGITQPANELGPISKAESYFHFIAGSIASLDNDAKGALEHFRLASESDPTAPFILLKQAEEYLNLNRMAEARELLVNVSKSEVKNPEFYLLQARLGSQESDLPLSLKSLDQAVSLFMDQGNFSKAREMVLTKVALLADNHEYNQSVSTLEKFLKQQPDDEIGYYFLGKIHTIFQNRAGAKKAYRKAIELRPTFSAASKALGLQLELEGKLKEAVAVYQAALRGGANDEELIQKLINLSLINEDYTTALEYLRQYLFLRPDDLQSQMRAGLIYYKMKNYPEAQEIFENILKAQATGQDRILFYLASLHDEQDHYEQAAAFFERIASSSEYFVESQLQLANLLFSKLKNPALAIERIKSATEKRSESQDLFLGLATLYEQNLQTKEAIQTLQIASEKFEDNEKILFMLGSVLDRAGDFEGSIKMMRRVLAGNMNNAHALNHIGYSYAERGINLDEAETLLKRAIQISPENGFIVDSLGWAYYQMARYKKALEVLERADKLSPNQPVILEHLADTYQKCGKKRLALEVYKKIMRTSVANNEQKAPTDVETRTVQDRVREKMALLDTNTPN